MRIYKSLVSPVLTCFDSERTESVVREALHLLELNPVGRRFIQFIAGGHIIDPRLQTSFGGIIFENPVIMAAGWDRNGRAVEALGALGFSGVEVGTVVQQPQAGNPRPRQWVVAPGVVVNSIGFYSEGVERVAENLARYRECTIPIGINIVKNRDSLDADAPEQYAAVARRLFPIASYFVINVSSPNTPGLRKLQEKGPLTAIVRAVRSVIDECGGAKPLLVKIAPELEPEAVDDVIEVVIENNLTGIVSTNTSNRPELKGKYGARWRDQPGGLSGDDHDYRLLGREQIAHIYRATRGRITVLGVGGVKDGETALEKIRAGATAVQLLTALRGEGPRVVHNINQQICRWMDREGVRSLAEIVGADVR